MADLGGVRRQRILELLRAEGSVRVADLSRRFRVTPETIRREINRLAGEGRLQRVHGGAMLPAAAAEEPFPHRLTRQSLEKGAIARAAAELVEDGDVIALDASTTALALGQALLERGPTNVVVVTSGAELPLVLGPSPSITVVSLGGTLRWRSRGYVGPQALRSLARYRLRKAFISCQGCTVEAGPSESGEEEAQIKAAMVRAADETVLLVDHTKWGKNALVPLCGLDRVRTLVTDREPPALERRALTRLGVELRVAGADTLARVGGTTP